MVKRKRVPLELNGTDEQYFRTKEISGQPVAPPPVVPDPKRASLEHPTVVDKPKMKQPSVRKSETASLLPPVPDTQEKGEIISRIIHLGKPLSKRIQATAEKFGVPVDDLLYAARKKAIVNFRSTLSARKKPIIEEFEKGGETMRIAVSLSSKELSQLKDWFDPLDLGLGSKMVSPLMTCAFRIEVGNICDAAG